MRYSDDAFSEETTDASEELDLDSDDNMPSRNQEEHEQIAQIGTTNPSPAFFPGLRSALVGGHSHGEKVSISGGRRLKVTADELDYLKTVADRAVTERQAMEQEYEKTSFQLQEAQSEVTQLASTTKYLKSQLKDYEEMMDRTIRNERRRSKVEIQKMKEIMEASIEQDRESLRKAFTKELERLQTQYEAERAKSEGAQNNITGFAREDTSWAYDTSDDEEHDDPYHGNSSFAPDSMSESNATGLKGSGVAKKNDFIDEAYNTTSKPRRKSKKSRQY